MKIGYLEKLADQVRQRKQRHGEPFKHSMVEMQFLMRPLRMSKKDVLARILDNSSPALRIFMRPLDCRDLDAAMSLADEFEELDQQRKEFERENNVQGIRIHQTQRTDQGAICRRWQDEGENRAGYTQPSRRSATEQMELVQSPSQACRRCGGQNHWARECRNRRISFCWLCGKIGRRTIHCCQPATS